MRNLILLISILAVSIAGKADNPDTSHRTIFFGLSAKGLHEVGKRINKGLLERLTGIPYLALIEGSGLNGCSPEKCGLSSGKKAGAHRIVYGAVSVKTGIEKSRLAETGVEKYIIKTERRDTYRIRIKVVDVESGELAADISKETEPVKIDKTLDEMAVEIAKIYSPRETVPIPVVENVPGPVIEKVPEQAPEASAQEEKTEQVPKVHALKEKQWLDDYEAAAYFSFIYPVGSFGDVAKYSLGNIIEVRRKNLFIEKSELRLAFGYYYASGHGKDVTFFNTMFLAAYAGYRLNVIDKLTVTPLIGFGYHLHFVQNRNYSGTKTYPDPLVSLKLGADHRLSSQLSLAGALGYTMFFETGSTGMYPGIDLGLKYSF